MIELARFCLVSDHLNMKVIFCLMLTFLVSGCDTLIPVRNDPPFSQGMLNLDCIKKAISKVDDVEIIDQRVEKLESIFEKEPYSVIQIIEYKINFTRELETARVAIEKTRGEPYNISNYAGRVNQPIPEKDKPILEKKIAEVSQSISTHCK